MVIPAMQIAVVFPGQGSQSVGMMNGFADAPVVARTFEAVSYTHLTLPTNREV